MTHLTEHEERQRRQGRAVKVTIPVKGVTQGMFLQVREPGSPVLLFLHGGPGMPEFWMTQRHPTRLHEAFTVAWWEQRGAGLSYHPGIPAETMTVEQFIDDTITVAQYLCRRFDVDKVHLMAHSWGSFIGLQAAAQAPELFHSYIGMAQATHQIASEQEAFSFMLEAYRARGDQRMVRRLERYPVTGDIPLPRGYEVLRDPAMHRLGVGTTHAMGSVVTGIFLPSLASPDYTPAEKVNLWRGRRFSRSFGLWDQMLATDLATVITRLEVPAYFLHGRHDRTVSYQLAKAYAARLNAPHVGFYTFDHSAHSPAFEEPDRTLQILTENVLTGTTTLADPPTTVEPCESEPATKCLIPDDVGGGPMDDAVRVEAVSETLFLPLYALALDSQRADPILNDPAAVDLTRQLNRSFAGSDLRLHKKLVTGDLPATLVTTMALRIRRYDRYVADFLATEPDGVVVNLGCGLDDRRRRVDNGRVRWFDLDLPEVIALRRAHLAESDRMRFLACSVLDLGWLDTLPDEPGDRFLFVAEGLFMYLPPEGVRALVTALHTRFPGAELVAEVAHSRVVRMMRGRLGRGKFRRQFGISGDVVYQFGVRDSRDMEAWAPGLVLLDDWAYFDEDEPRLGWMRPFARWPLFRQAQWTVHYRLGAPAQ